MVIAGSKAMNKRETIYKYLNEKYNSSEKEMEDNLTEVTIEETIFGDSVEDPDMFKKSQSKWEKLVTVELRKYFPKVRIDYQVDFKPNYSGITPSPDISFETKTEIDGFEYNSYEEFIRKYLEMATRKVWSEGKFW